MRRGVPSGTVVSSLLADAELVELVRGAPWARRRGEHDELVEAELQLRAQRAEIRARLELRRVGLERALAVNPSLRAGDRVWDEWSVLDAALRADAADNFDRTDLSAVGSEAAVAETEGSGSGAEANTAAPVAAAERAATDAAPRLLLQLQRCADAAEALGSTALLDARYAPPPLEMHGKAIRPGDALGVLAKEALVRAAAVEYSLSALRSVVDRSAAHERSGVREGGGDATGVRAALGEAEKLECVTAELNAYAEELERSCCNDSPHG